MTDRSSPRLYRYPLEALTDAMGLSFNQGCRALGISGSTQQEYRDRGVTEKVADRLAVRAGLLPSDVWPTWYADQDAAVSKMCADEKCGESFLPGRSWQRFCSAPCRYRAKERERRRRKYEEDPEWRARVREANNAYRRENRRAIAVQKRTYRRRKNEESAA